MTESLKDNFLNGNLTPQDKEKILEFIDQFYNENPSFPLSKERFKQEFNLTENDAFVKPLTQAEKINAMTVFGYVLQKCADYDKMRPLIFETKETMEIFGEFNDKLREENIIKEKENFKEINMKDKMNQEIFEKYTYNKLNPIGDGNGNGDDGAPAAPAAMDREPDPGDKKGGGTPPPPPAMASMIKVEANQEKKKQQETPEPEYPEYPEYPDFDF